ncbi:unnamed protein product [Arctia plantaginis]|uniref:Uncharacterized protein n=1 Tax=Arctia plantaginis TaxID=874455 RepID=A0A8S1AJB9_ARCPL|nr:unnamed protein product [Arctia plantaginis]
MNFLLVFKISITAIVLYGDASSDNIDMAALEDTVKQFLDSQTFQEILANEITHFDDVRKTELEEKEGEELYSMKEKPNLSIIRRIASSAYMNLKKQNRYNPQNYFEAVKKKSQMKVNLNRIKKIIEFMEHNVESTRYFHSEVQRIKKNREVRDEIRKMIHIADTTSNKSYAKAINECYDVVVHDREIDLYSVKSNNLVIEIPSLTHV